MRVALAIAAAAWALSGTAAVANDSVQPVVQAGETLVLIEASGATLVRPTQMQITLGVVTTGETAAGALQANNLRMTDVLNAVADSGVKASDVQTSDFDVEPQFRGDKRRSDDINDIVGYMVTNKVTVTFDDIDRAGEIISTLFDAGANSVSSPRFDVEEDVYKAAVRQAERQALANARVQVENLATELNMKVSRVLRLSNVEIDFDRGYSRNGGGYIVVTGSRIADTPIEAGEIPLNAELFVEYALVGK